MFIINQFNYYLINTNLKKNLNNIRQTKIIATKKNLVELYKTKMHYIPTFDYL